MEKTIKVTVVASEIAQPYLKSAHSIPWEVIETAVGSGCMEKIGEFIARDVVFTVKSSDAKARAFRELAARSGECGLLILFYVSGLDEEDALGASNRSV